MPESNQKYQPAKFPRTERLKSRTQIAKLFIHGKSITKFPIQIVYNFETNNTNPGVKVAFSISKRKVKQAVKRNQIKRKIREAYRLNKSNLLLTAKENNISLNLMFIYKGKEIAEYSYILDKTLIVLKQLEEQIKHSIVA